MLALIPARGGSKGLPDKNIKMLAGKPLIAHTIEAARQARRIERVVVSTNDPAIADVSRAFQAEIPFIRPASLATDSARAIDAYIYSLEKLNLGNAQPYEDCIVLLPTSPLRTAEDIDQAVDLYREKRADSIISVCEAMPPPTWAKKIDSDGVLRDYFPLSDALLNRQQIAKAYMPNGAIYVLKYDLLKNRGTYYSDKTFPYIMPRERSVDIDDQLDFEFAEYLLRKRWKK